MGKRFDVIVFGATGFTGRRICKELYDVLENCSGPTNNWAVAGRCYKKLDKILKDLDIYDKNRVIVADVEDSLSLEAMCSKGKVLLNCVGPYIKYGEPVVKACINSRCDYLDITGEKIYMEMLVNKYHQSARSHGVLILPSCGFSSIPSNLGLSFMKKELDGEIDMVDCYFSMNLKNNSQTYNVGSLSAIVEEISAPKSRFSFAKNEGHTTKPGSKAKGFHWCKALGKYAIPFPSPDVPTVRRSQASLSKNPLQFNMFMTFDSVWKIFQAAFLFLILNIFSMNKFSRKMLLKYPEFLTFGSFSNKGPNEQQILNTSFEMTLFGHKQKLYKEISKEKKSSDITVKINGPEMAYVSTPITMVQAGMVVLFQRNKLPKGGVYDCGAAFENTDLTNGLLKRGMLIKNVTEHGLRSSLR